MSLTRPPRGAHGQAGVEFVALLPLMLIGFAGCWQAVLAAHTGWSASAAARAAARAHAVGAGELAAARAALPDSLDHRVAVEAEDGKSRVTVRIEIPAVVPGLHLGTLSARAAFASQR